MAQKRNRPMVTLTLDPNVLEASRALLARIPGETVTLSSLVEDLLRDFVLSMGPLIDQVEATDDPIERLRAIEAMFGREVAQLGHTFVEAVSTEPEDMKRR